MTLGSKNNPLLDIYYFKETEEPKLYITWNTYEDMWTSSIGTPEWRLSKNKKRKKYLGIWINILGLRINLNIKLKSVGLIYYGRNMEKTL